MSDVWAAAVGVLVGWALATMGYAMHWRQYMLSTRARVSRSSPARKE